MILIIFQSNFQKSLKKRLIIQQRLLIKRFDHTLSFLWIIRKDLSKKVECIAKLLFLGEQTINAFRHLKKCSTAFHVALSVITFRVRHKLGEEKEYKTKLISMFVYVLSNILFQIFFKYMYLKLGRVKNII